MHILKIHKHEISHVEHYLSFCVAESTSKISMLQKYKSRCNDYYWNDDADYNKALPMALAMPKPSMHDF